MGIIYEAGRSVLTGESEEGEEIELLPGKSNFIPVNSGVTEVSLTKKWALYVKLKLEHLEKKRSVERSANKILREKFVLVRKHVDYAFQVRI